MSGTRDVILLFIMYHVIFMKNPMGLIRCEFIWQSVFMAADMALLINNT